MTVIELERYLENQIPQALSCDWDNDGRMLLPEPEREVKKVLIALDVTDRVIARAIRGGFDVILTHHPLIFKPLKRVDDIRMLTLIRAGVAVYSYHTRLDALSGGVNDVLAKVLGIKQTVPFGEDGMGRVGVLDKAMTSAELAQLLKQVLGAPWITVVDCGKCIRRVAVLGGAGKDFLADAAGAGADAFVTGEVGYNALLSAAGGEMSVFCAGHYYTEQPACVRLGEWVREAIPEVQIEIFESCELQEI